MFAGRFPLFLVLVVVVCFVGGVVLILRTFGPRANTDTALSCTRCHNHNSRHAKFCANCGQELER